MSSPVQGRKPYVRPMQGWWKRDPFFVRYMVRETTAIGVAVYAVVLALGAVRLAQGESAWNAWLAALKSPLSLLLHVVLLLCFVVHAKSWFEIMPKTMPMMVSGGKRVEAATITRVGFIAVAVVTVAVLALASFIGGRA
jgi:fumarate reductase subunit C